MGRGGRVALEARRRTGERRMTRVIRLLTSLTIFLVVIGVGLYTAAPR